MANLDTWEGSMQDDSLVVVLRNMVPSERQDPAVIVVNTKLLIPHLFHYNHSEIIRVSSQLPRVTRMLRVVNLLLITRKPEI